MMEKCVSNRFSSAVALVALLVASSCQTVPVREPAQLVPVHEPVLHSSPREVADGGLVRLELTLPEKVAAGITRVRGKIEKGMIDFYPVTSQVTGAKSYEALVGIPFGRKPGEYRIPVVVERGEAPSVRLSVVVAVVPGNYLSETLSVDPRHVNPGPEAIARMKKESSEIGWIYRNPRLERAWKGAFALPIDSPITSPFGTKRVYNGEMQSFHQGLDLRAPVGTPVMSGEAGVVALAKDLYMTGNTVILDHGFGLFTIYGHMSALKVSKGQVVQKGELLGLAGATGRASGPHLHWGAVVHRSKINPFDLTRVLK